MTLLWLLIGLAWAEECAECHPNQAASFADSAHALAFETPVFAATWAEHPQGWCVTCHLPDEDAQIEQVGELRPGALYPGIEGSGGLTCETCHVRDGAVLSSTVPSLRARKAHRVVVDRDLGVGGCARCHEFAFPLHAPSHPFALGDSLAQSTVSEWEEAATKATCSDCHLGEHGHSMPGEALLVESLTVDISADRAVLTAHDAAHAVPTGDPFRRLMLELCADAACEEVVATHRLGQTFVRDDTTWRKTADTRIPPAIDGSTASTSFTIDVSFAAWRLWSYRGESRLRHRIDENDYRRLLRSGPHQPLGETP